MAFYDIYNIFFCVYPFYFNMYLYRVGAFNGDKALIKRTLYEWNILKGVAPNQTFYNWNGDVSPVVHQYDRYYTSHFKGQYAKFLRTFQEG